MKLPGACLIVFAVALVMPLAASAQLPLDRLFATPALDGTAPSAPRWSPDARHVAFTWNADALPRRELWVAAASGSGQQQLSRTGYTSGGRTQCSAGSASPGPS